MACRKFRGIQKFPVISHPCELGLEISKLLVNLDSMTENFLRIDSGLVNEEYEWHNGIIN